jgi:hypothetical protein
MAVRDQETERVRVNIYRRMTPQKRMIIAAQLYEEAISNMRSAILDRYPDLSELELEREMRRRLLPRPLFLQVEAHINARHR